MAEERRQGRQEPLVPLACPLDLDAEDSRSQQLKDDQETLLAEPVIRQRVDVIENVEKPDWAKDLTKSMAQMQLMMKEKGIDAAINYSDLSLGEDDDPLP